jgi:NADH:ubiquinone oxidoreductase subunit C
LLPDKTVVETVLTRAGVAQVEVAETTLGVVCRCAPEDIVTALAALKECELDFAMLPDLLGTDTGEGIEITYHLRSFARDEDVYVKIDVAYDAEILSVWNVFPSALLPERETAELLGLRLAGHPNPKRILTTDDSPPLLRRDVAVRTVEEVRDR